MEATRRHRLPDLAWLAVTLAILGLGFAIVAWEWRNAYAAASLQAFDATHQHGAQSNPPEVTTARGHE
jgi:hypothetical protein